MEQQDWSVQLASQSTLRPRVAVPGRADGCPSGPPTDPYVRNARIRFLKQSLCYPPPFTGVLGSGLVSAKSLPWFPLVRHSARRRLPSRGSLGPRFPTFSGTLRRYDCHHAPLGSLRLSRASRSLACFPRSWSPRRARGLVEAPRQRQGLWAPGPPGRASRPGDRGLSHVPAFPLWTHAPLSDPGGVLRPCHGAPRTAAFRRWHTVGCPLDPLRASLRTTTLPIAGLHHAACLLAPPGFVRPLTGRHAGSLLTGWPGVRQGGLAP